MSAVRAFYFDIAREKIRELDIALDVYQVRTLARQIDPEIRYGNSDIFSLSLDLELSRIVECIRALDIAQNQHMGEIDSLSDIDIHRSFRRLLDIDNPIGVQLIYGSELWHLLEQLRDEVPQLTIDSFQNNVVSHLKEWWQANGRSWTKKLREVLINDRNIGHDWQLSVPQEELLGKYYDANSLLINCLNSNGYVTRSVREEIEATLLLPQSLLPSAQT